MDVPAGPDAAISDTPPFLRLREGVTVEDISEALRHLGPKIDAYLAAKRETEQAPDRLDLCEEHVGPCPVCIAPILGAAPAPKPRPDCYWCLGGGRTLTKRIYRAKDVNEQAAVAELKRKDTALESAAKTLEYAADLFLKLGHPKEAAQTTAAAVKLREEAQ